MIPYINTLSEKQTCIRARVYTFKIFPRNNRIQKILNGFSTQVTIAPV